MICTITSVLLQSSICCLNCSLRLVPKLIVFTLANHLHQHHYQLALTKYYSFGYILCVMFASDPGYLSAIANYYSVHQCMQAVRGVPVSLCWFRVSDCRSSRVSGYNDVLYLHRCRLVDSLPVSVELSNIMTDKNRKTRLHIFFCRPYNNLVR